jgi:hypothetical protein
VTRAREDARPRPTFTANQTGSCPGWIPVSPTQKTSRHRQSNCTLDQREKAPS